MIKKIFIQGKYVVITENGKEIFSAPISETRVKTEDADTVRIYNETNNPTNYKNVVVDIDKLKDADGNTLEGGTFTWLRENTGFNTASGGSGVANELASIAALKLTTGKAIGDYLETIGYYENTNVGGATYKKVDPSGLTANDMDIIEATDGSYWQLAETERVTPYMFGCRAETAADTLRLQRFFDYCDETKALGDFQGKWIVNATIEIKGEYDNIFIAGTINPVQTGLDAVIRITMKRGRIMGKLRTIGGSLTGDGGTTGTSTYGDRTSLNGVVFDNNGGRNQIDAIEANGFKKWGVNINQNSADGQSSILDWIGNIKAWNCGSGYSTTRKLEFQASSFINNGSSASPSQTATLNVDNIDEGLEGGSLIKIGNRVHYIIDGTIDPVNKKFDIYPWVDDTLTFPQTVLSMHGGGCLIAGNNTANIRIDQIDSIGSGSCLKHGGLYGSQIGILQSQLCHSALTLGFTRSSANLGGELGILYSEADLYSIVQVTESPNLINIQSCPELKTQSIKILQRGTTGGGDINTNNANFTVVSNSSFYTGGKLKQGGGNMRNKSIVIGNSPDMNDTFFKHDTKAITVKWDEDVNRVWGYETFQLKAIGTSNDYPSGNITLNVDAADQALGYTIMGGTSYVLPKGNVFANYIGYMKYSSKDWRILRVTPNAAESGTTANRPNTTIVGYPYYNTSLGRMEWWNGTAWVNGFGVPPTYADDTTAGSGGLTTGQVYKTATGVLMIKL